MKICYKYFIFFLLSGLPKISHSQTINGFWKSEDKSRIYQIIVDSSNNRFTAVIYQSYRKSDKKGDTILSNISLGGNEDNYTGIIHSTIHSDKRFANIKLSKGRQILSIKIPRFVFFPVSIYWYRY